MILTTITTLIIGFTIFKSYKMFQSDKNLIKRVYTQNLKDYPLAFALVIGVIIGILALASIVPDFMKFSWISLLSSDGKGTNLVMAPFTSGSIFIVLGFWVILSLCLPYLAKDEEVSFRGYTYFRNKRIIESIKFGFVHMIVGVPIFAAIVLCFVGYVYSMKYVSGYKNYIKDNQKDKGTKEFAEAANEAGVEKSTSLHAKYNFILITLVVLSTTLVMLMK